MTKRISALILGAIILLSGCTKEGTETSGNDSKGTFNVQFVCEPADEWFNWYDIKASYTEITGKQVELTLQPGKGLNYKASLPAGDKTIASRITCLVKATKKAGVTPSEEQKVNFSSNTSAKVTITNPDGSASLIQVDGIGHFGEIETTGTLISKFLESRPEGEFINFTYEK